MTDLTPDDIRTARLVRSGYWIDRLIAALDAERARADELADKLADAEWADALMTAQRDEAFKHLTKDKQHECIRAACRTVQPLTVERLGAAALAVLEEPQ